MSMFVKMWRFGPRIRSRVLSTVSDWTNTGKCVGLLHDFRLTQSAKKLSPPLLTLTSSRGVTTSSVVYRPKRDYQKLENLRKQRLVELQPKMGIIFKCKICDTRNAQSFSKKSYEEGVVIVKCGSCNNNHLIADNLGWFQDVQGRNIEEILASKGEEVMRASDTHLPLDLMEQFNLQTQSGESFSSSSSGEEDEAVKMMLSDDNKLPLGEETEKINLPGGDMQAETEKIREPERKEE